MAIERDVMRKKLIFYPPSMGGLHIDILTNHIFVRLPVKSLSRFKCVCKEWHELIHDPKFINLHLKHQVNNRQKFLVQSIVDDRQKFLIQSINNSKNGVFYSVDCESADAIHLQDFPLRSSYIVQTFNSCNGIVSMTVWNKRKVHLVFWNPATGGYKMLPDPISPRNIIGDLLVGFGYESSFDDYKFVRVNTFTQCHDIFSLRINSWRTIRGASDECLFEPNTCRNGNRFTNEQIGFAVDGYIYWLVRSINTFIELNLKDEEFRKLSLPFDLKDHSYAKVIGGSLSIIKLYNCNNQIYTDLWSRMKEEENKKKRKEYSWIKLMTISMGGSELRSFIHPFCFMRDGKVLCYYYKYHSYYVGNHNLVVFDPETKRHENFSINRVCANLISDDAFMQSMYIESLVSPNYCCPADESC